MSEPIFTVDVSEFNHKLQGLDFSSPVNFAKSLANTDYKIREASEQALYEYLTGNDVNGLPENIEIVSDGVTVWGTGTVTRMRELYQLANGKKVTARAYTPPVRIAKIEDTTEIIKNSPVGTQFMAEREMVAPVIELKDDTEMPEPRYAKTESELSASRAKKYLMHNAAGIIREKLKLIALYDNSMLQEVAEELKAKIDYYVSQFS